MCFLWLIMNAQVREIQVQGDFTINMLYLVFLSYTSAMYPFMYLYLHAIGVYIYTCMYIHTYRYIYTHVIPTATTKKAIQSITFKNSIHKNRILTLPFSTTFTIQIHLSIHTVSNSVMSFSRRSLERAISDKLMSPLLRLLS